MLLMMGCVSKADGKDVWDDDCRYSNKRQDNVNVNATIFFNNRLRFIDRE